MRCATANEIKRHLQFDKYQKPREGTPLRRLYDLFQEHRARPICMSMGEKQDFTGHRLEQLRSRYGLDIRRVDTKRWMLVGEWDGRVYVDYVAERVEEHHG